MLSHRRVLFQLLVFRKISIKAFSKRLAVEIIYNI